MKVVLISCASKKKETESRAEDLYISTLFKYNLKYAKSMNPDKIFILSAKYGVLDLNEVVDTYNVTLNAMSPPEVRKWADEVLEMLKKVSDVDNDEFVFLAGESYRKFLLPHIKNYSVPMNGLGIGKQLKFLKEVTNGV